MAKSKIVEVEFVSAKNRDVFFKPIQGRVRGRKDYSNPRTKREQKARENWPEGMPGQIAGIDLATGERYIREPLHDEAHEQLRAKIIRKGYSLPPKRASYDSESVCTWVYHMQRLVDVGVARITEGELPPVDSFEGEKPKTRFITNAVLDSNDKLIDTLGTLKESIEANTQMLVALAARIAGK